MGKSSKRGSSFELKETLERIDREIKILESHQVELLENRGRSKPSGMAFANEKLGGLYHERGELSGRKDDYLSAAQAYRAGARFAEEIGEYKLAYRLFRRSADDYETAGMDDCWKMEKLAKKNRRKAAVVRKTENMGWFRRKLIRRSHGVHVFLLLLSGAFIFFLPSYITGHSVSETSSISPISLLGVILIVFGVLVLYGFILKYQLLKCIKQTYIKEN
ncbi:MAG: hypothetical protein KKD18_03605 [Nanoarchaeota archaeon]|nr:hypothetical protein [Nanoarchaeota archaeon]MBU0977476.1 hypothetical protein [Nanoarchaeota archaeon]